MAEHKRLWAMLVLTLALISVYFVWDNTQFTPFVNGLRLKTLGAIVVTAMALGSATLLFHAISNNRIVTPSSWAWNICTCWRKPVLCLPLAARL